MGSTTRKVDGRINDRSALPPTADLRHHRFDVRKVPHPDSCTAAKNELPTIGVFGRTRFWFKGDRTSFINFKARRSERRWLWPRGLRAESPCRIPLRATHF